MTWEAWFTSVVVIGVLFGLIRNLSPVAVLFGGLAVLMTGAALTGSERLPSAAALVAGFGNPALITVGLLFIVAAGLVHSGAMTLITEPILGRPKHLLSAQTRLLLPACGLSVFTNNTPMVAMFLPVVDDLARRSHLPPSRLFLPFNYATILGGLCSLLGTSTNLVVNGLVQHQTDLGSLDLFDPVWVGVPVALVGLGYILVMSPRLLPDNRAAISVEDDPRRYTAEVTVESGGPLVGRTIEKAGLRHLPGLFLAEIERDGQVLPAVAPTEVLHSGDRLVFAGVVDSVVDLYRIRGIQPATDQVFKLDEPRSQRCLVEAVVSNDCAVAGTSIREGRFRTKYDAVVIAVARGGHQLGGKIGEIVLQPGDTLLMETHPSFLERQRNARDFFLVSQVENSTPRRHHKAGIALATLAGMVVLAATGVLNMLNAALLAAGVMVVTGCVTGAEARRSVDWPVLLVIGAAFGIGKALETSGTAAVVANGLIDFAGAEPWLVLFAVYAVTMLATELITNNAAAVLVFPIALAAASALGVSFMPFIIVIMIAASCGFATPFGYQTNMMVYGPGGYRFADYLRFGLPLNLLVMAVAVALTPLVWSF
ncbi:MAG: SLC13 family permease [Nitrococcus sp.]|nr:SLC13 family permease [Nitrococcus sp.]